MEDNEALTVRHVAEYAYCPRLFYLMEVEGVFVPSADTEKGRVVHKRVDRPSHAVVRTKGGEQDEGGGKDESADTVDDADRAANAADAPHIIRSLALSSESLGITGKLDLVSLEDNRAVPIEYRKGRPRRIGLGEVDPEDAEVAPLTAQEPWPTDLVQVGLQVLLLEEVGYEVPEAALYYASEKLRLPVVVDDALRAQARATLEQARAAQQGERPPPLVNDPKCVGCSLQPVCLPDEINQQRLFGQGGEIKRLWPPRDDGILVIAQTEGCKIGVRGHSLRVTDREGKLVRELPLSEVQSLSVVGGVQVSTQALHVLADRQVPVAFLSAAGRLITLTDPLIPGGARARRAQIKRFEATPHRVVFSRELLKAKIGNQRRLIQRNHPQSEQLVRELTRLMQKLELATSLNELMGLEGMAAKRYFSAFGDMVKGDQGKTFSAHGRKRRPPPDPVNATLSFAYAMLTHECVTALRLAGLDPALGALHVQRPGRPSLALDLMEPFRPLVADSLVLTSMNRGDLTAGHFHQTSAGCLFTDAGRKAFFKAYGRRMNETVTHPVFGYRLSYRRMIQLHARMIAAWLLGEIPTLSFLTTR